MTKKRVLDFCLYAVIAMGLVFFIVWGALHLRTPRSEIIGKWGGLAVNTLIVFGYTIRNNPRSRKVLSFWALIIVILFVHLLFFSLVLEASEQWKLGWWVLVAPIEYLLIGLALGLVRPHRRSHSN